VGLAIYFFARRHGVPLLTLGDMVAACAPIGLFFGRIANFINGELWGRPTTLPWGMIFPTADGLPRHPSQLYEAVLEGLVLFSVLRLATHVRLSLKRPGLTTGVFLFCYGLFRISLENVREPDAQMPNFPFGLTMGMMLSAPMMLAGLSLIVWALRRPEAKAA
jgi:phosphatidylglycerol:prolipoprotein diacylglycerol transferase